MQAVQFQGISTALHTTSAHYQEMQHTFPGSWVKLGRTAELHADNETVSVSMMKPYWYEHPYFIGGVVGLLLGVAGGVLIGRATKKRR